MMDSALANPILLVHRAFQGEEADAWLRLQKALKTLGTIEVREAAEIPYEELFLSAPSYAHIFLDIGLADYARLAGAAIPNLTLVNRDPFLWNKLKVRELMGPCLRKHSCLLLEDLPAADIVRTLHLFLAQKRLVGVTPLLEKGSIVVAEKIQSLDALGNLTDRVHQYVSEIEQFSLRDRLFDFRLALLAMLAEGFDRAVETGQPYPTVDFQVGVSRGKLVLNLRFSRGRLDAESINGLALESDGSVWSQAWARADFFQVTHHVQHDEIEVMLVMNRPQPLPSGTFRTYLWKKAERSGKRENLMVAPQNFEFRLLSQVRINQSEQALLSAGLEESGAIDLGNLPIEVVNRLSKLEQESEFYREQLKKKDSFIKEAVTKITEANREISKKRNELLRLAKAKENQEGAHARKTGDLEKKIETLNVAHSLQAAAAKETAVSATNAAQAESTGKLEVSVRALENDKAILTDKLGREEKKLAAFEQKYSALYKEITQKDKELNELKANLVKARKEQSAALAAAAQASGASGGASADSLNQKLKEAEAREVSTRQELKKMAFKVENNEKNVKAIQAESLEKIKLLEQKLQGAKTKEVELLKKIEELSVALKKAAKAA